MLVAAASGLVAAVALAFLRILRRQAGPCLEASAVVQALFIAVAAGAYAPLT